jgi:ABC transporter substrate binding protein
LAGYRLGQVGTDWGFTGLGGFNGTDTTDMLLRSASTGGFEVYDISNNNITNAAFLGNVGLNWQVMGFGNFSSMPRETDMILRNVNNGGVEVYNIANNQITGATFMGAVGLNWQFSGVGNFSGLGESDMLLRNSNTADWRSMISPTIRSPTPPSSARSGSIGSSRGVGNFSGAAGETDLPTSRCRRSKKYGYSISSSAWPNTVGDMSRVYPGTDLLGAAMKEALQSTLIFVLWVVFWLAGTISGAVLQAWLIDIGVVSDIGPPWIITIGSSFIGFFAGAYAATEHTDVVIVEQSNMLISASTQIAEAAAAKNLPAVYGYREHVEAGGLISYGVDLNGCFHRAAYYVDRILKGAKPADLPVEFPTRLELVINIKVAKSLDLEIPPTLLARADEVIE